MTSPDQPAPHPNRDEAVVRDKLREVAYQAKALGEATTEASSTMREHALCSAVQAAKTAGATTAEIDSAIDGSTDFGDDE